jgi:high-affinity K+ transport system ATPase subunit B
MKNPVIFVVEVGAVLTTGFLVRDIVSGASGIGFQIQIALWLWFTVLFANFAEAMAEARGKAQADALRKTKTRVMQHNVLAMSGKAVEASGDVNTLLLDKTGTITIGNREAVEFLPLRGVPLEELADAAQLSSLADETPEGRSLVVLGQEAALPGPANWRITKPSLFRYPRTRA